jgi:hypothetical protein
MGDGLKGTAAVPLFTQQKKKRRRMGKSLSVKHK